MQLSRFVCILLTPDPRRYSLNVTSEPHLMSFQGISQLTTIHHHRIGMCNLCTDCIFCVQLDPWLPLLVTFNCHSKLIPFALRLQIVYCWRTSVEYMQNVNSQLAVYRPRVSCTFCVTPTTSNYNTRVNICIFALCYTYLRTT